MKRKFWFFAFLFILVVTFCACDGCDGDKYLEQETTESTLPEFDKSLTYIVSSVGDNVWADTVFGTCYSKIPSLDEPLWFDVVIASDDINSAETKLIRNYFYLHVNLNTPVKEFFFEDTVIFDGGYRILYYENKTTNTEHVEFSLYMTSPQGRVVITENDSQFISGYFEGTMINAAETSDKRNCKIEFNKVPLSLAK